MEERPGEMGGFKEIIAKTTLQRKGASGIPLHLVRTDIAGNISKRFSLSDIHIPRHSGACPRWNIYAAFLAPERINVQVSQMPDGQKFFCIARTITRATTVTTPRRYSPLAWAAPPPCKGPKAFGQWDEMKDQQRSRSIVWPLTSATSKAGS